MDFFTRLETIQARWNVLEHPFYTRWERGELTREDLGYYASQYRYAVVALASASAHAAACAPDSARAALVEHADEEASHVALWDDFVAALPVAPSTEPRAETSECVAAWTAGRDAVDDAGVLYAVESAQPEISRTKLRGLVEHYGMGEGEAATAYFRLHAVRDIVHAREAREFLETHLTLQASDGALARAEGALRANWRLLDGVEAALGR